MNTEQELRTAYDQFHLALNDAFATGGEGQAAVAFLGAEMTSWTCIPGADAPIQGDRTTYAESIRQAVGTLGRQARWSYDHPTVMMRSNDLGVISATRRLHQAGKVEAVCTLSVWRREESNWRLHRTYEEFVGKEYPSNHGLLNATLGLQAAWLGALQTGDASPMTAFFAPGLLNIACDGGTGAPEVKDRETCIAENMAGAADAKGMEWSIRTLAALQRSADEGVVLTNDIAGPAHKGYPLFGMEVWRHEAGEWRLLRLYQEM